MRIGTLLDEPSGPDGLCELTDQLRQSAEEGFDSAWLLHTFGADALTALAVASSQVPDIAIGTAVVPTYPRHPGALAQQARTTALAAGADRMTLGIGLSHKIVIENMFGYDFDRPARHMKEYLSVLVPLLEGGAVSYSGELYNANLGLSIPDEGRVSLLLAALGTHMLRLADGTVLWMTGATSIREHIAPAITAAAERPAPRIVCVPPVLVTDDVESARRHRAELFARGDRNLRRDHRSGHGHRKPALGVPSPRRRRLERCVRDPRAQRHQMRRSDRTRPRLRCATDPHYPARRLAGGAGR